MTVAAVVSVRAVVHPLSAACAGEQPANRSLVLPASKVKISGR
jgi:hypothetical protein